jgi:hypothetical protein
MMPLEALLMVRRMRLATRQITLAITAVVLVFGMLTALHAITRALKDEIVDRGTITLAPYTFFELTSVPSDEADFDQLKLVHGLAFVRMSEKFRAPFRCASSWGGTSILIVAMRVGRFWSRGP